MRALAIHAGPTARALLQARAFRPEDVRVVPAAAGGPKSLVLNPLDRFLFGHWLARAPAVLHLLGASIGAWRMATACLPNPDRALAELAEAYIEQGYEHAPGRLPTPRHVSEVLGRMLQSRLGSAAADVLGHARFRLHVFVSRGRGMLARPGRFRTVLGCAGAFAGNAVSRRSLGAWFERMVFSDPRTALPVALSDYRTRHAALDADNLVPAVQASCSIPFWIDAVRDIPGAPDGTYWDGGITDYHLHLDYSGVGEGIVLYPHFHHRVVPGWLDKPWKWRHRAGAGLSNVIVLAPDPEWVRRLPHGKLPDRSDFRRFVDDARGRVQAWRRALAESQRLADEFAEVVLGGRMPAVQPLA